MKIHESDPQSRTPAILAAIMLIAVAFATDVRAEDEEFVVVRARKVITVSGDEIDNGMIVIADGKVKLVGTGLEYPDGAKVIDARRETVMPGLIHPRTRYGLVSFSRSGVKGHLSAGDEMPFAEIRYEDFLRAGYSAVAYYPNGNGIPGVAKVVRTAGPESSRVLADPSYLRVNLVNISDGKRVLGGALKKAEAEIEKVKKAKEEWDKKQKEKAEAEKKKAEEQKKKGEGGDPPKPKPEDKPQPKPKPKGADDPPPKPKEGEGEKKEEPEKFVPPKIDPAHQPVVDLIQKKEGRFALVELRNASGLLHFDDAVRDHDDLSHVFYLSTGVPRLDTDFHYAIDALGEREAQIILPPAVNSYPLTVARYCLADELARAGCSVSFVPWRETRDEFFLIRQRLADLVRAGMDRKVALQGVTQNAAKALGLGERLGTIEEGKDADLVFFNGDPLSPHAEVARVMILGEVVWEAEDDD